MKNAFNLQIPEMKDILADPEIEKSVSDMLGTVLSYLGIPDDATGRVVEETFDKTKKAVSITEYEKNVHALLDREGVVAAFPHKLLERTKIMVEELRPYLLEGSVLDLGCGDGKTGELLADTHEVQLADVFEHLHIKETGLDFTFFKQGELVPIEDNSFDNTLSIYVYHHSDDPIQSMLEAKRVTRSGGRIIVMESVYGVDELLLSDEQKEKAKPFLRLSAEQQRLCNIFFDHFWNRVLMYSDDPSMKINVPFNFNTPDGWKKIFEANGLTQEKMIHMGMDQPTVPEYHTMHILRVN
ncbi:MAG: class I SAM-dependent methyltransferase [bacterium]|nr:class I SAM-dependent methyltransferase [bacterium]